MKAIGIVGSQASGKSVASKIGESMGIRVIRMGDIVREEILKQGLKIDEATIARVASEFRQKEGMHAIAKRTAQRIKELKESAVIIDGIRGGDEVKFFKKEFGDNFKLIAIIASSQVRYERVKARKRADDALDMHIFIKKDEREASWGIEGAIALADFTVKNEGAVEEFEAKIKKILEEVAG